MGLFDDSTRLFNRSFSWALGRYRPGIDDDPDSSSPPPDIDELAVYVDDEGVLNINGKVVSYSSEDPIDIPAPHSYSPGNNFIAQLNRSLTTVPIGGLILYPTYQPLKAVVGKRRYWYAGISPRYQGRVRYPDNTPPGFVPCVGQVLRYPDGSAFQVAEMAPPITSWGTWGGGRVGGGWGGGYTPGWGYLPNVRYLQRVPEGWVGEEDPARGKYLDEIRPDAVWEWWWGKGE